MRDKLKIGLNSAEVGENIGRIGKGIKSLTFAEIGAERVGPLEKWLIFAESLKNPSVHVQ